MDQRSKPHPIKDGIRIICNTENFVLIVVPGLSTSQACLIIIHDTFKAGESFLINFFNLVFFTNHDIFNGDGSFSSPSSNRVK